jgi:hypothetical protein
MHNHDHKKDSLQSRRFVEKKRTKVVLKYIALTSGVLLLVFALSKLSAISFLQIDTIEIVGADANIAGAIRSITLDTIESNYLGIFSKANTLIYPKSTIIDSIEHTSPEIEKIDVERNGRKTLLVNVDLKIPEAVICTGLPEFDERSNEDCYLADKSGYVFKSKVSHVITLPILYIQQGTTTDIMQTRPIDSDRFAKLVDFYRKIMATKIKVLGLLISDIHDEIYIANSGDNNIDFDNVGIVYISEKFSLDETFSNLVSFWNHMNSLGNEHIFSEIKLQFPPNVYYTEI